MGKLKNHRVSLARVMDGRWERIRELSVAKSMGDGCLCVCMSVQCSLNSAQLSVGAENNFFFCEWSAQKSIGWKGINMILGEKKSCSVCYRSVFLLILWCGFQLRISSHTYFLIATTNGVQVGANGILQCLPFDIIFEASVEFVCLLFTQAFVCKLYQHAKR